MSDEALRGGFAARATFLATSPHDTASWSAFPRTVWAYLTVVGDSEPPDLLPLVARSE